MNNMRAEKDICKVAARVKWKLPKEKAMEEEKRRSFIVVWAWTGNDCSMFMDHDQPILLD
jgi:hypothetical protein